MVLTPFQAFVWVVCLELVTALIIIFVSNTIMIGRMKVKEQHQVKLMKGIAELIETKLNKSDTGTKEENHESQSD